MDNHLNNYSTAVLKKQNQQFCTFHSARFAVDVTFQQSFHPSGSIKKRKRFFCGKHKLYRYKVKECVVPNVLAIALSHYYPGQVSDFEIFQNRLE